VLGAAKNNHSGKSGPAIPNVDGGIKVGIFRPVVVMTLLIQAQVEASMCHLRGLVMLKLNRSDQAKQCFLEALALDVKCYDSFEQLINGEMMSADEGDQFLPSCK
jgi:anaphase-promoting complex subunit 6